MRNAVRFTIAASVVAAVFAPVAAHAGIAGGTYDGAPATLYQNTYTAEQAPDAPVNVTYDGVTVTSVAQFNVVKAAEVPGVGSYEGRPVTDYRATSASEGSTDDYETMLTTQLCEAKPEFC